MKTRTLTRNEFSSLSSSVRYFLLEIEVATSFPICVSLEELDGKPSHSLEPGNNNA